MSPEGMCFQSRGLAGWGLSTHKRVLLVLGTGVGGIRTQDQGHRLGDVGWEVFLAFLGSRGASLS